MQKADVGRNFQWFLGPDSLRDGLHLLQLAANKTRISSHLVVVGSNPAARQPLRALRCIQNDFTCPTMEQASRQSHCLESIPPFALLVNRPRPGRASDSE